MKQLKLAKNVPNKSLSTTKRYLLVKHAQEAPLFTTKNQTVVKSVLWELLSLSTADAKNAHKPSLFITLLSKPALNAQKAPLSSTPKLAHALAVLHKTLDTIWRLRNVRLVQKDISSTLKTSANASFRESTLETAPKITRFITTKQKFATNVQVTQSSVPTTIPYACHAPPDSSTMQLQPFAKNVLQTQSSIRSIFSDVWNVRKICLFIILLRKVVRYAPRTLYSTQTILPTAFRAHGITPFTIRLPKNAKNALRTHI